MQDLEKKQAIIGEHPLIKEVFRLARRVAPSDLAVNISGETGTGKELLARFIHAESTRRKGPFVAVDCGVLTLETARSELFGHVRGAFTGAHDTRCGLVAEAAGGTLFLDEVGELDLDLQLQLLRLVQEGEFRRMGESRVQRVDVRLIVATHRDLEALVGEMKFRADLYYRLQVLPLVLPPLRSRSSDIRLLVDHFLGLYPCAGRSKVFTNAALDVLERFDWPGNVRELQHEIARLLLMVDGERIGEVDLADRIREAVNTVDVHDLPFKEARRIQLQHFMCEYLHRQLLRSKGNVTSAARESGVGRQYFQMRMAECGLYSKAYKREASLAG
ncbi:MAG: DNA-binding NtrC family response regulator [Candidatus Latescibacterota bacterium]|jgi:DNA-binding NtrC family response regulator